MTIKKYPGLTQSQTQLLTNIAFGADIVSGSLTDLNILSEKGLIETKYVQQNGYFYRIYEMPIPEHIKFCEWCEKITTVPPMKGN